ncbi:MAG: MATE family efflux transporter [Angelakisella sp.]|jgi:putative MATE family efflux protein|nr:MATE family efflux transporter [Angelakisella sp.]
MESLAILRDRALRNSILGIAVPIALQNLITYMTGMMDTVMLGQLGEVELSGASLANQFGMIYMVLTFGIASGTNVLLSQYWGKGDTKSIRSILSIMYRVTLVLSILFTAVAHFFPEQILSLFSNDPVVIAAGSRYLALVCFSYTLNGMTNAMLMSLRSVGTVGISIVVYIVSFFANTSLNWVLIFGKLGFPALGMEGAAIATIIARGIELTIATIYLLRFERKIGYTLRDVVEYDRSFAKDFAINVTPVMLNELIWSLGNSMVIAIMGRMGRDLVSANAIANITAQFTQVFIIGIANATSVVIGNSIGMGEQERTRSLAKAIMIVAAGFGVVAAALMLLLRGPVIGLYNIPEATKILTNQIMAVFALTTFFRSMEFVGLIGILRGGGDNRFVLFCDVFFLWAVAIPLGAIAGLWLKLPAPLVCFILQCDIVIKLLVSTPRIWGGKWVRDVTRQEATA